MGNSVAGAALALVLCGCSTTVKTSSPFTANTAPERKIITDEPAKPRDAAVSESTPPRGQRTAGTEAQPGTDTPGRTEPRSTGTSGAAAGSASSASNRSLSDIDLLVELDGLLNRWVEAHNLADEEKRGAAAAQLRPLADAHHDRLVAFLRGDSLESRIVAAGALGFSSRPEAIPVLLDGLRDSNAFVRSNAALSLGVIGSKDVPSNSLVVLLRDPEAAVRASGAYALSRIVRRGDDAGAVPALIECLRDTHFPVRNEAVRTLAVIGDPRATLPLCETTLRDPYFLIRVNTGVALAKLHDLRAVEPLVGALDDADENIRKTARYALGEITGAGVEDKNEAWKTWWTQNREQIARRILQGRPTRTPGATEEDLGSGGK